PSGLQIGPTGNLDVVDLLGFAVRQYNPTTGAFIGDLIPGGQNSPLLFQFPSDLLFDGRGHLLVADLGFSFSNPTGTVKEFDATTGAFIGNFATGINGASQLAQTPSAVPEIDPGSMAGALALLVGGILVLRNRVRLHKS